LNPPPGFDGSESGSSTGRRTPLMKDYLPTILPKIQTTLDFIQMVKMSMLLGGGGEGEILKVTTGSSLIRQAGWLV